MVEEMTGLHDNGTREMVSILSGKSVVVYQWVFIAKYLLDWIVEHYNACLVAKGYTQDLRYCLH